MFRSMFVPRSDTTTRIRSYKRRQKNKTDKVSIFICFVDIFICFVVFSILNDAHWRVVKMYGLGTKYYFRRKGVVELESLSLRHHILALPIPVCSCVVAVSIEGHWCLCCAFRVSLRYRRALVLVLC
jgi:hypothetical protein